MRTRASRRGCSGTELGGHHDSAREAKQGRCDTGSVCQLVSPPEIRNAHARAFSRAWCSQQNQNSTSTGLLVGLVGLVDSQARTSIHLLIEMCALDRSLQSSTSAGAVLDVDWCTLNNFMMRRRTTDTNTAQGHTS